MTQNVYLEQKRGILVGGLRHACKAAQNEKTKEQALRVIDAAAREVGAEAVIVYQRGNCTLEELIEFDTFFKHEWRQARSAYVHKRGV